jgi:hypothetical protein
MASIQRSLRAPEDLDREITREVRFRGERDWSRGAISLMEEAVRASRVPGIVFVQRRDGRRPYCWGANTNGRLGTGDGQSGEAPRAVAGDLTFALLSIGVNHACGSCPVVRRTAGARRVTGISAPARPVNCRTCGRRLRSRGDSPSRRSAPQRITPAR